MVSDEIGSPSGGFIGNKRDWLKVHGGLDADEECDQSEYDLEDESFGLPLKSRHLDGNFDDILQEPDASKKVRFVEGRSHMTMEQLLENTSNLNIFVENNMDKISDFRSGLDVQEWYRSATPDTPTGTTTKAGASAGSMSNFQLSEAGDRDTSTAGGIDSDIDSVVFDRRLSNLLATTAATNYQLNATDNNSSSNDMADGSKSSLLEHVDDQRDNTLLMQSLLTAENNVKDEQKLCMSSRDALKVFDDLLRLVIDLSSQPDDETGYGADSNNEQANDYNDKEGKAPATLSNPDENATAVANDEKNDSDANLGMENGASDQIEELSVSKLIFQMKSAPTVSITDYLDRIETKCSFPPIIYLTAASLLIAYSQLKYDTTQSKFQIHSKVTESMAHRLLIAFIRVAAKLLEDNVHSHTYFSKVCGVSKKLLSRLELNLILLLQDIPDGLIITERTIQNVLSIHKRIKDSNSTEHLT